MRKNETSNKNKKRIIKVFIITLIILAALALISVILERCANKTAEIPEYFYDFSTPNYEENIFENEEYLSKDRYLSYTDDMGVTVKITDGDYSAYGLGPSFFALYFYSLEHADYQTFESLFTDNYKKTHELPKNFTMQKIYNKSIAYYNDETKDAENFITYKVEYYIMKNDGTFRDDMGSDCTRTQYITLKYDQNGAQIDAIKSVYAK